MVLHIVRNLLNDLNSSGINYCHWKSNEHLYASFEADTDLDILFDYKQNGQIKQILKAHNFHLFNAVWYKKYSGIEDYIGFDKNEGKTVHVHLHFNLDLGEVGIKSYNLPWEKDVLSSRVYNEEFEIYTSSPTMEYLLLVVRTALKKDTINYRSNKRIVENFNREAQWLYPLVTFESLSQLTDSLLNSKISFLIQEIRKKEEYDKIAFIKLQKLLKIFFKEDRVMSSRKVVYLKYLYFSNVVKKRLNKIPGINFELPRRSLPNEGVVISLMGPDGAGKSTQTKLITKEFKKKVDVKFIYMGSGKGEKSFQRKIIDTIFDVILRIRPKNNKAVKTNNKIDENDTPKSLSNKSKITQFILSIKAVSLAFERKNKLKKIKKERKKGTIVICDRYPQTEFPGFNDGLRLVDNLDSKSSILRSFARYEKHCYDLANEIYPDLVVKFSGNVDVLHYRRPEMDRKELEAKQDGILKLKFTDKTKIINVNIENDLKEIKAMIINETSLLISEKNKF